VPASIRRPFTLAGLGVLASWSIAGLYLALGPRLSNEMLHTTSHLAGGASVLALTAPAAISQLIWADLEAQRAASYGAGVVAAGMALTAASLSTGSVPLFLAGSVITGAGFGVAFMGALRSLSAVVPAAQRAEVMSAFYVVAYLSISLPTVAAGLAAPAIGLKSTFLIFSAVVVVVALAVSVATRGSERHRSLTSVTQDPCTGMN
jgi:hypothetical protein